MSEWLKTSSIHVPVSTRKPSIRILKNSKEMLKDVPAENILNYDETNLSDNPGKKKLVFKRGIKYPDVVKNSSKSFTSLMYACSGDGTVLPRYVVYKSECKWDLWTLGGLRGTRYNNTKSGWFDTLCFRDWFMKIALLT